MSAHHPSVIQWWGDEVWKSDNPECFNRPVVAMFEDSRGLFRARIATRRGIEAGDTGNKCETTTGMPDHHYGFVRLGCGVYADKHPADFVKGGIGEVIVFDEPLSPSEKTSVYEYLRDKWLYGMDVMPPPIVGGADVTAARPDLLLSDGTTLAYTGVASNRVSAVTLDAGAQVTVRLDRVPGRDETVDFLGYEELNLNGGRVEVGSENARKHKIGYSNSWMQILRNVPGLLLLFR